MHAEYNWIICLFLDLILFHVTYFETVYALQVCIKHPVKAAGEEKPAEAENKETAVEDKAKDKEAAPSVALKARLVRMLKEELMRD